MKKILMLAVSLFILCGIFTSCSKENKNKVTGNVAPPVVQPNDPTIEEIINSTDTFNSSLYKIDQIRIGDNIITSDIVALTIIPKYYPYTLSFRIKDKNSDNYAWQNVVGENWDITGSTVVLKGLNGFVIWAEPFYKNEPQNCQISINFKGLSYTKGLTFKTETVKVPTWDEQFDIDYANGDLNGYNITAQFKHSVLVSSLNYIGNWITTSSMEIYNLKDLNNWNVYIDGRLKTDLFSIEVEDGNYYARNWYTKYIYFQGKWVIDYTPNIDQGFKVKNGILEYVCGWHYADKVFHPGDFKTENYFTYEETKEYHKCNVNVSFTIKNTTKVIVQSFRCCH